jgi:hypothetical protein
MISDRDPKFTSRLWREMFRITGTRFLMATAYHPQTDGHSERKNQTIEIAIRYHVTTNHNLSWVEMLPALQHHLNNSKAEVIGCSPNELVYGFKPLSVLDVVTDKVERDKPMDPSALNVLRIARQREAKMLIDIAAILNKQRYDQKHRPVNIQVGDEVYIRLHQGYHVSREKKKKVDLQRAGPFKVLKEISPQAFKLDLPKTWRIHPVISAAQLWKPVQGKDPFGREQPRPPPILIDNITDEEFWEIDRLVDHSVTKRRQQPKLQFRVHWKGYSDKEDTWQDEDMLNEDVPGLVDRYLKRKGLNRDELLKNVLRK